MRRRQHYSILSLRRLPRFSSGTVPEMIPEWEALLDIASVTALFFYTDLVSCKELVTVDLVTFGVSRAKPRLSGF